jgi:hypothetical protein
MEAQVVFIRLSQTVDLLRIESPAGSRNNAISLGFHRLNGGKSTVYVRIGTQLTRMQQTALPDSSTTPRAGNRRQLFGRHVDHPHKKNRMRQTQPQNCSE